MDSPRVLSIQSHVVRGYVGNKSAVFPLQVLGFEVDAINSVQFSNHTGYKVVKGQILNEDDLDDLAKGLIGNGLDNYTHLLTGYMGNPKFLSAIGALVKHLKNINPDLIYVCDPVMGDNHKMYVPESILPVLRDEILSVADIITPNQFELELLTGRKVTSVKEAWEAIDELHKKNCKLVVVSSSDLGDSDELITLASRITGEGEGQKCRVMGKIPKIDATFTGTGDLFAALLLAWTHLTKADLLTSLNNTISTLQAVLKRTFNSANAKVGGQRPLTIQDLELLLVQSKKDIENPLSEHSFCTVVS